MRVFTLLNNINYLLDYFVLVASTNYFNGICIIIALQEGLHIVNQHLTKVSLFCIVFT